MNHKREQLTRIARIMRNVLAGAALFGGAVVGIKAITATRNQEIASTPADFSWKSWKRALVETKNAFGNKNLGPLASSVAYGGTLAFFPLVVACVAIASTALSPDQIKEVISAISNYLPKDMAGLLTAQLSNALGKQSANVLVAISAIVIALFGVSGAMNSLVGALNVAYERDETRGMIKVRLTSLGLTAFLVVGLMVVLPLISLGGSVLEYFGVPEWITVIFSIVRWPLLAAVMVLGLAVVYRYAPDRKNVRWQWVSWGAMMATICWLLATALFFVYVQYFANFSQSYSLFAGIIVLMTWLNYTGLVVLVGAEVNNQLERQTVVPTTT